MKIYTRTGDDGTTSLAGGRRVPKDHLRTEAYGSVDELISWVGLIRDLTEDKKRIDFLVNVQNNLMRCAAALVTEKDDPATKKYLPDTDCLSLLENEIDLIEAKLPVIKNFVLPGGNVLVSYCHIARCVCRRAERAVIRLNNSEEVPELVYKFLNRLSDYLFVLSRMIVLELDIEEITWSV